MATGTVNKRVTKVYSPETLQRARELYQGGMSLEAVGKELGIPYSTVRYHGWVEDWGVRAKGVKRDLRKEAEKAKRLARKLKREETLMLMEASLVKAEDLEVLARKSLLVDSARAKVMISRRVGEIVARLDDPSVPVRSAAQALGALAPILKLLYQWNQEPSLAEMKRPMGAINPELINTPPEELGRMHRKKLEQLDHAIDPEFIATTPKQLRLMHERKMASSRREGSFETVQEDHRDGTLLEQRKGPPPSGAAHPLPQKEAPTSSTSTSSVQASQSQSSSPPRRPIWEATLQRGEKAAPKPQDPFQGNPPSATTPSVQFGSPPLSPEERRKQQLEELAQQRAEWRGQSWRK